MTINLSRRKFIGGLLASAAAPVIAQSVALDTGFTTQVITKVPWNFGLVTIEQMRDLLLPGLFEVRGRYETIPEQWFAIFAEGPDTEV